MDVSQFLLLLLKSLSGLEFVEKVDFKTEVFILKGRANLGGKRYLQVYFNELTGTTAFALIEKGKRIWGIRKSPKYQRKERSRDCKRTI